MKLPFGQSAQKFGTSVKDLDGFKSYNRFIVLSSVTSNSIPNILDLLFNLSPFGTDTVMVTAKKTRVLVINTSEVFGSIHGMRDIRNRNVYIHHGMADCDIEQIDGDTPIIFTDIDWNVIVDKPTEVMGAPSYRGLSDVQLSYDIGARGYEVLRNTSKNNSVLIPTPEYYDEKDMVMLGGRDESYGEYLFGLAEDRYDMNMDQYVNALHKSTLNTLMDDHTKVYKLNIQIENLSSKITTTQFENSINDIITEICSQLKYELEHAGYSNAEIILNGKHGYNVPLEKLRTYLNLSPIEARTNFTLLCGGVDSVNEQYMCDQNDYSLLIHMDHANVKVCIVDLVPGVRTFDVDKTDTNVKELGEHLKFDNPGICEWHAAMERDHS